MHQHPVTPAVVFTARRSHHHPRRSLTCSELSGPTSPGAAASMYTVCDVAVNNLPPTCHVAYTSHFTTSSALTGVLWYSTGQKWSLCYQKVHDNQVRVIRRHLCIKPRTFDRARKIRPCNLRVCVMRDCVNKVLLYIELHNLRSIQCIQNNNKMLSYRRETALQGAL